MRPSLLGLFWPAPQRHYQSLLHLIEKEWFKYTKYLQNVPLGGAGIVTENTSFRLPAVFIVNLKKMLAREMIMAGCDSWCC